VAFNAGEFGAGLWWFEKLKGKRSPDYSMRLNDQFRLIFQIEKEAGGNRLVILEIEDYH
jgi:toxin HigB-1